MAHCFEDLIMVKAAKRVIVTAEKIIDSRNWENKPQIPGFLVESVVLAEKGAAPGSCSPFYAIDEDGVASYLQDPASYLEQERGPSRMSNLQTGDYITVAMASLLMTGNGFSMVLLLPCQPLPFNWRNDYMQKTLFI